VLLVSNETREIRLQPVGVQSISAILSGYASVGKVSHMKNRIHKKAHLS